MSGITQRTEKLIGRQGAERLQSSSVLIVGLGGVGGCVFEMLVRAGVGNITAVDGDVFEITNLNRQILSTVNSIGKPKASVAALRAKEISPGCNVTEMCIRYNAETSDLIFSRGYDYVADCIDSVADKTLLIVNAVKRNIPVLSAMGSGNRLSPDFRVTDIYSTSGDGLARVMRKKLREAGIKALNCVCDSGLPCSADGVPGTVSYAPNMSGCLMAQKIITDLLWKE